QTPGLVLPGPQGWPTPVPAPPHGVQTAPIQLALTGTVAANAPNGAPVIQTEAGQIQSNARAPLPVGSTGTLEITAQLPPPSGYSPPPAPPPTPGALPFAGPPGTPTAGWPALTESIQLLQRTDPQAAAQLSQAIPDGGARTAVAIASFVNALRT